MAKLSDMVIIHTGDQPALAYLLPLRHLGSTGREWMTQTGRL